MYALGKEVAGQMLTEQTFAETVAANGGRVYRVGGCVRDTLMGVVPKDIDFCVAGMVKKNFKVLFPEVEEIGKSFPVFRLLIDGKKCEVAFARTERKEGSGYKGFKISSNPKVTIQDDLYRRDTTVNSMAVDCLTGELIDPFQGRQDIKAGILRATSEHFSDDPMRALRLAGQSARLGFTVEENTLALARAVGGELAEEPSERLITELTKVLEGARLPADFFKVLHKADLLQIAFPEVAKLSSQVFDETMEQLDLAAQVTHEPKLRFAALGFTLSKETLLRWNHSMTLPGDWVEAAAMAGKIKGLLSQPTPENVVAAINQLRRGSLSISEFDILAKGVRLNVPELNPLQAAITLLPGEAIPKDLKGKEIGEWYKIKHIAAIRQMLNL
jgi:tRNA nucleotidyltransferase (CCA-adding enzyme)